MLNIYRTKLNIGSAVGGLLFSAAIASGAAAQNNHINGPIKNVLLISIDGMHALDFINCRKVSPAPMAVPLIVRTWRNSLKWA